MKTAIGLGMGLWLGFVGMAQGEAQSALLTHPLQSLEGQSFALTKYQGSVVVVNFWASWCKPCKKEMPLLKQLHEELQPSGGQVLGISVDRDEKRVHKFLKSNQVGIPVVIDGPEGLAKKLDLKALPMTYVLDTRGNVVFECKNVSEKNFDQLLNAAQSAAGKSSLATKGAKL